MIYKVTQCLPENGERVLAYGYKTYCCECDKEKERSWHEVIFSFRVFSYKLKKEIPEDIEETILEECECDENWDFDNEESHLIGVTQWQKVGEK